MEPNVQENRGTSFHAVRGAYRQSFRPGSPATRLRLGLAQLAASSIEVQGHHPPGAGATLGRLCSRTALPATRISVSSNLPLR